MIGLVTIVGRNAETRFIADLDSGTNIALVRPKVRTVSRAILVLAETAIDFSCRASFDFAMLPEVEAILTPVVLRTLGSDLITESFSSLEVMLKVIFSFHSPSLCIP
jgi:hypothetical protein